MGTPPISGTQPSGTPHETHPDHRLPHRRRTHAAGGGRLSRPRQGQHDGAPRPAGRTARRLARRHGAGAARQRRDCRRPALRTTGPGEHGGGDLLQQHRLPGHVWPRHHWAGGVPRLPGPYPARCPWHRDTGGHRQHHPARRRLGQRAQRARFSPAPPVGGGRARLRCRHWRCGLGREGSHHGMDDYVEIKYLCLGDILR